MDMPAIHIDFYEALTEAGVKPDTAQRVERQVELAIVSSHDAIRQELPERLMTKHDGDAMASALRQEAAQTRSELRQEIAQLRTELHQGLHGLTWRMVGLLIASHSALLAALKYLQ